MNEAKMGFSADGPLLHPDEDELDYAPFANHLAKAIVNMASDDGFVMAIYGNWGLGKSTVLNFTVHYLEQYPDEKRPIILRFTPWWFSNRDDLTRLLISQLRVRLGDNDHSELKSRLADLVELVSKVPVPGLSAADAGEFIAGKLRGEPDIAGLKDSIGKLLLQQKQRVLILIDDIDRLSTEEIKDLFRTIKATANFPNIIYLLAFDVKVVIHALEKEFVTSGQDYLEKIVQVPFELPQPDQIALRRLLLTRLDSLLVNTPEGLFDQSYWANVYFDGLDHFIKTPRDVIRLTNVLRATYPVLEGEVNPVDLIAIEALRVFTPKIYEIVRENQELITGVNWQSSFRNQENNKKVFDEWLEQAPDPHREGIKRLLTRVFPRFGAAFGGGNYAPDYLSRWRKELRICSPDLFQIYFRFSIPTDTVTASDMRIVVEATKDSETFRQVLKKYSAKIQRDGISQVRIILERLLDYTSREIELENIPQIIEVLYDLGDQLLRKEDNAEGLFGFDNGIRIARIVRQLLSRLDQTQRFDILQNAIASSTSLAILESEVAGFGQEQGKYDSKTNSPEADFTVNKEQLSILEGLVLGKIQLAATNNTLLDMPNFVSILHRWKAWAKSGEEISAWVLGIVNSDDKLPIFLAKFGQISQSNTIGDYAVRKQYRLNPQWLEPFIDPKIIVEKVQKLGLAEGLPDEQTKAMHQFLKEYRLLQEGKDLSLSLRWE
jgi:predicted KAP-like P-loop ATPase